MLKMTHFWVIFGPFLDPEMLFSVYQTGSVVVQKVNQKWVIFSIPRARARARARGDKTGFVLEMPCTRPCMDFPKMTHFWVIFGQFLDPIFGPLFSIFAPFLP